VSALGAIACCTAVVCLVFMFAPAPSAPDRGAGAFARWRSLVDRREDDRVAATRAREVLQGTLAGLRAGLPLSAALRAATAERTGAFGRAMRAFDLGMPLDTALRDAAARSRDRRVMLACDALALVAADQLAPTRSAAIIASVSDRLAFEDHLLEDVRARTAGARAQIALLAVLVPAIALYLAITLPGLAATLTTPLGTHVLLPAAALFEGAGLVASRRIVRGLAT